MAFGQFLAQGAEGVACIGEVIDDQPALAVTGGRGFLGNLACGAFLMVIARIADGFDYADIQFAGNQAGRDQPATRHRDDTFERAFIF